MSGLALCGSLTHKAVCRTVSQSSSLAPSTPSSLVNLSNASFVQLTLFQPPASPCFFTLVPRRTSNRRSVSMTFDMTIRTRIESTAVNQMLRSSNSKLNLVISLPFMLSSKVMMSLAWHFVPCDDLFSCFGPMSSAQWYLSSLPGMLGFVPAVRV